VRVTVTVDRRREIADPEGEVVKRALADLGHSGVADVRMDRVIHMEVDGDDPEAVRSEVEEMCRKLLANPVLEDFKVEIGE